MLVLSRKVGEAVCVGNDVVVEVQEIRGNRVRLSFRAPHDIGVDRQEVRLQKIANRPVALDQHRTRELVA